MLQELQTPNCPLQIDQLCTCRSPPKFNRREAAQHTITATMSADPLQVLAGVGKGESTRTLLRVIILFLIAGAAIASRLFSVIRKCPVPDHEP